jgi:hypothetical protein
VPPTTDHMPLIAAPTIIGDGYAYVYEQTDSCPRRHLKLSKDGEEVLRRVQRGWAGPLDDGTRQFLQRTGVVDFVALPEPGSTGGQAVVDASLGGPSVWAREACKRVPAVVMASFAANTVCVDGARVPLSAPLTRFRFTHLVRLLIAQRAPSRILIVGREIAAKLFDFLPGTDSVVVETGFAEDYVMADPVSATVQDRALEELLFRDYSYPWDCLAHSLAAAQSIRSARLNAIWNAQIADKLAQRFPASSVRFFPPNTSLHLFPFVRRQRVEGLRVLAGMGAHTAGPRGREFLSLDALLDVCGQLGDIYLTCLSSDPERLARQVGPRPNLRIVPYIPREELPTLFEQHDVYYRVQQDPSIPLGCLEAMASGLLVVMADHTARAFPQLRDAENAMLVPPGDIEALAERLKTARDSEETFSRITRSGAALVREHCTMVRFLEDAGILP